MPSTLDPDTTADVTCFRYPDRRQALTAHAECERIADAFVGHRASVLLLLLPVGDADAFEPCVAVVDIRPRSLRHDHALIESCLDVFRRDGAQFLDMSTEQQLKLVDIALDPAKGGLQA